MEVYSIELAKANKVGDLDPSDEVIRKINCLIAEESRTPKEVYRVNYMVYTNSSDSYKGISEIYRAEGYNVHSTEVNGGVVVTIRW